MSGLGSSSSSSFDIAVVGGGIVGLATAYALRGRFPSARLVVLEKEREVGTHQTGRNSGVIHSGIYYKPGSLKATLCVEGARRMVAFCREQGIRTDAVGKVIVATSERELPRLEELHRRGVANGVRVERIGVERLRELEPHAAGIAALHSPDTQIVDYGIVARRLRGMLTEGSNAAEVRVMHRVGRIDERGGELRIETDRGVVQAGFLINCAGLYSDVIAERMGLRFGVRIVPFRGEYYFLKPERRELVKGLIYPVPDPDLPFLGVHFTRTVHGDVEAGPNAVLAFAREGYAMNVFDAEEFAGTLAYGGFWKMARQWWRTGAYEFYRSVSRRSFVRALQKLVPEVTEGDVVRGGAGVRAQAVDAQGGLVQDFRFASTPRSLHVLNAPSPAATASLAIGDFIAGKIGFVPSNPLSLK